MPDSDRQTTVVREYMLVIRRRAWIVVASSVVAVAVSLAISVAKTPMYVSTATLVFQKQSDISSAIAGTTYVAPIDIERELKTSAKLMTGRTMAEAAQEQLETDAPGQSAAGVIVAATAVEDTNALTIDATSADPDRAAAVANAFAFAFMSYKQDLTVEQLKSAKKAVQSKLNTFNTDVEKADPSYAQLTSMLQDIVVLEETATSNYRVAEPAASATAPYTPRPVRDAILAAVIGLIAGIAVAFLAEQLDVRVREQDELTRVLGLPILGRLPRSSREASKESSGLIVEREPDGRTAEAMRILRGNLDFTAIDTKLRAILVTSATQAEGKTTTLCNLAVTLALTGKRVAVVDADLRRPRVHQFFNLTNRGGLSNVAAEQVALEDAVQRYTLQPAPTQTAGNRSASVPDAVEPILILTAGPLPPNPNEIVTSERMGQILNAITARVDVVLVDSPPFLAVGDAAAVARRVDGLLLVLRMGQVTRPILRDANDFLRPLPCKRLGVVLTNASVEGAPYRYRASREAASDADVPSPIPEPLARS